MTEPRQLRLAWGGATDQGRVRAVNQDAMYADRGLFVVADGMGGHQGGEVAANLAVRAVADATHDSPDTLREAVNAANRLVHETAIGRPELHGMGTTLTAIAVVTDEQGPRFSLVNVGDSRIYRQRDGALHQLTADHSYVAELMRRGDINAQEAENHPYRNMLTRAIGVHPEVDVDEWLVDPLAGDRYVLCSDGLTNEVSDEEINAVLNKNPDVSEAARALVQLANLNGGRDNATVLIVDVRIDRERDEPPSQVIDTDELPEIDPDSAPTPEPDTDELIWPEDAEASPDASVEPAGSDEPTVSTPVVAAAAPGEPVTASDRHWLHQPVSVTTRMVAITIGATVVLVALLGVLGWYARSGYHVGTLGDEVVVYKGRSGGLLWFDPTLEERPGILLEDLTPEDRELVLTGQGTESLAGARSFIADLATRTTSAPATTDSATPSTTTSPDEDPGE